MKKSIMISMTLGILLSVLFAGPAMANHDADFDIEPQENPCVAPCEVVVRSTSPNPDGETLFHEWDFHYAGFNRFRPEVSPSMNSQQCLNPDCSVAKWTYTEGGGYDIGLRLTGSHGPNEDRRSVQVGDGADEPAPLDFLNPGSVELGGSAWYSTTKQRMVVEWAERNPDGSYNAQGFLPVSLAATSEGINSFEVRFPTSVQRGSVRLRARAWTKDEAFADAREDYVTVVASAFSGFRSPKVSVDLFGTGKCGLNDRLEGTARRSAVWRNAFRLQVKTENGYRDFRKKIRTVNFPGSPNRRRFTSRIILTKSQLRQLRGQRVYIVRSHTVREGTEGKYAFTPTRQRFNVLRICGGR